MYQRSIRGELEQEFNFGRTVKQLLPLILPSQQLLELARRALSHSPRATVYPGSEFCFLFGGYVILTQPWQTCPESSTDIAPNEKGRGLMPQPLDFW